MAFLLRVGETRTHSYLTLPYTDRGERERERARERERETETCCWGGETVKGNVSPTLSTPPFRAIILFYSFPARIFTPTNLPFHSYLARLSREFISRVMHEMNNSTAVRTAVG